MALHAILLMEKVILEDLCKIKTRIKVQECIKEEQITTKTTICSQLIIKLHNINYNIFCINYNSNN
jgi:hypothetical protein